MCVCAGLGMGGVSGGELDDDSEMLGGEKEMEAYRQSMAVKRAIQMQLGHRYGPRWSIPECECVCTLPLVVWHSVSVCEPRDTQ